LYKDQGLREVKVWLDQLFTPYVHEAYRMVRERHASEPVGFNNALSQFNACLQPYNKRVEWNLDETIIENDIPLWAAKLFVDGDCWGHGRGSTKKTAKNEAAKQGHRRLLGCGCEEHTLIISEG
jgi:ribonuclease-3